ncbi:MAG: twin-arginine translocation signal domain-containing protein, partial [Janthinobacterium lividum]
MSMNTRRDLLAGCTLAAMLIAGAATAQQQTPTPPPAEAVPGLAASAGQDNSGIAPTPPRDEAPQNDIIVVGSQIKGARTTAALPVTIVDAKAIAATGAVSGDELLRSIPQFGDVTFNPSNNAQTSNSARGDVNSINLRNLGVGNTLVL